MLLRSSFIVSSILVSLLVVGCAKQSGNEQNAEHAEKSPAPAPKVIKNDFSVFSANKFPAPNGEIVGPGGEKTTLRSFAGKPFLLAMWSSTNPASIDELQSLDAIAAAGKLRVVALNVDAGPSDGTSDAVTPVFKAQGLTALQEYRDPTNVIFHGLNAPKLPQAFLYGSDGVLISSIWGPIDYGSPEARAVLDKAK